MLLAALAEGQPSHVDSSRVSALAGANGITQRELPYLVGLLKAQRVVDLDDDGLHVLGVTTEVVLEHTANIFDEQAPTAEERASLFLAEETSKVPLAHKEAIERLGDETGVNDPEGVLRDMVDVGFVDSEEAKRDRLYFNGNLFRRDAVTKAEGLLSTLSSAERGAIARADELLAHSGCIALPDLEKALGKSLMDKIAPLGFYDLHEVQNERGSTYFVTKPAAFSKFSTNRREPSDAFVDDALDMAKALVACLSFGMTYRRASEGRITRIGALLGRLVAGAEIGPATAIGRDYQALEQRGVVRIRPSETGLFYMRLLKPDVGTLALNVLTSGDTSHETLPHFPGAAVTAYAGPEEQREDNRRRSNSINRQHAHRILHTLRTGWASR